MMSLQNNNLVRVLARQLKLGLGLLSLGGACFGASATSITPTSEVIAASDRPLTFEANLGQFDTPTRFVARGAAYSLSLAPTELRVQLQKKMASIGTGGDFSQGLHRSAVPVQQATVQIELLGANPDAVMTGSGVVAGHANYFIGNDPAQWRTGVPSYARVRVTDVYPGIHLLHYGNQRQLEYDFEVMPGADPEVIALRYTGADKLTLAENGDLVLTLGKEELRQPRPVLHQTVRGQRKEISGGYQLADARTVKFWVGDYDRSVPLIIDPIVSYSTYFNGAGDDQLSLIAVGPEGDLFLAGETMSVSGLTTAGAFQTNLAGVLYQHGDAFVARRKNTNSVADVYVTYLGGIAYEAALGLAVDADGNAYVTGYTGSTNFPTRAAIQPNIAGTVVPGFTTPPLDCFIAKLGPQGTNLIFSTFFGGNGSGYYGSGDDVATGIAVDAARNIYVAGYTSSTNFPTFNTTFTNYTGQEDGFVLKLDATGTNVIYSMYLGGKDHDFARDIAIDGAGNPIVVGHTTSTNFPVTTNAFQAYLNQNTNNTTAEDAFIAKLAATTGAVTYATYLGGVNDDEAIRLATDAAGAAYVTGWTKSGNFPVTNTNFPSSVSASVADVFVAKLNPANTNLDYSIVFGGSGQDMAWDIAVDGQGQAHVAGETASQNFPTNATTGILRGINSGGVDAFLSEINSNGSAFIYSAYLGGAQTDRAYGVALDAAGNSYFVGTTVYSTFPITPTNSVPASSDTAGFIVKLVVQPALTIAAAGTSVVVSWPGYSAEFGLQSSTNLITNAWVSVATPALFTNGQHLVTLPGTNSPQFFRLLKP